MTQDLIKQLFYYEDGKLFNKVKRSKGIMVGAEAGYIDKSRGYLRTTINRKIYKNHRLIWVYHNGEILDGLYIDHINRDTLNNNIENLRLVTHQENQFNTKAKGYCFNKKLNKYQAQIMLNRKQKHLGLFDTEQEASNAYLTAKEELHIIDQRRIK